MAAESEFENKTLGRQTWRFRDSGQGRPVVLLHGFPDLPYSYASIARSLNDSGYRTILPYLRGYHPATIVRGRRYDAVSLGEDAIGLLDALEVRSAVFVGHDWGAYAAWSAAALAPERVDGIVPIAIPHPSTLKPRNALQALGALLMWRHFVFLKMPWAPAATRRDDFAYLETLYDRWAPGWRGRDRDASLERIKAAFRDPSVLDAAIDYYRALTPRVDPRLQSVLPCSGLMVTGERDFGGHLGPYKRSRAFFTGSADLLVVPEAGHWPHREREALFTVRLIEFLDRL